MPDDAPLLRTLSPALRGLERRPARLARRAAPLPARTMIRAPRWKAWPPTCAARPRPSTSIGRCSSSCSWAAPASANRRCSTPWPAAPSPRRRSPGRPRAIRSSTTTSRSGRDRLDPALRHCRLVAARSAGAGAEDPRRYARPRQQRPGQPREAACSCCRSPTSCSTSARRRSTTTSSAGSCSWSSGKRRAFAFVLNKWDRCVHAGASGLRPDEDLLRDLKAEGFENPLLFRTCAQHWVDQRRRSDGATPHAADLPEGEQFRTWCTGWKWA